ncbi:MAG: hypothetical protein FJY74_08440 [Candidatus Eisenbacteria bacterium]|nr:hypothetical protein [Candidatus Eisenbacteria bacterium]
MVTRAIAPAICVLAASAAVLLGSSVALAAPTFYGYIKLDASLDSAKTDKGDYAFIVLPYVGEEADDEFNMTANQTRLGMKFDAAEGERFPVSGRVEIDFYGGGAENKANPMMRQAYLEMTFPAFEVLAGQTADLISPLNPTTLNYVVLWKSGNTGYRRPQIRLTKAVSLADAGKLTLAASANRNMGRDENGEDFGQPSWQGRVGYSRKLFGDRSLTVGVSGLYGKESDADDCEFESSAIVVDATIPLGEKITVMGEYFSGRNLGVYLGGVGQGIAVQPPYESSRSRAEMAEIEASGWWGQLAVQLAADIAVNVGAGWDDPTLPVWAAADAIEKNTTYYGNVIWSATTSSYIGFEYAKMETEYAGSGDDTPAYENTRVQLSVGYRF